VAGRGQRAHQQATSDIDAFPTEAKERAKKHLDALKAAGLKPKKKKVPVEEHYDDLGDDLSGLGADVEMHAQTYHVDLYEPDTSSDEEFVSGMTTWYFLGRPKKTLSQHQHSVADMDQLLVLLSRQGEGMDVCELCGGEGRTTQVAVRRRLHAGRNFDLVTGVDLGNPVQ